MCCRKFLSLSNILCCQERSLIYTSISIKKVVLAVLRITKSTAGPCTSSLMRNGCHVRECSILGLNVDNGLLPILLQIKSLKGIGRAQMAKVIDCVFRATMCACDAKCNIMPNILDRMNCTRVVKIRTW